MKALEHPNIFHVQAASGWLELGNLNEARVELGKIKGRQREHPDVVEVRWQISARESNWPECVQLAEKVISKAPLRPVGYIHKAFALHELGQTQEAWDFLFPLAEKFPEEVTIKYNLACYAAQLSRLWEAEQWLKLAFTVGQKEELRSMALEDPDLKPLWPKIMDM
jgi:predicted Zn-dependent protease